MNSKRNIKRIGVLTSGGDAPGMNAAIRAVGYIVLGIFVLGYFTWKSKVKKQNR